ncbi:uncharacterized protein LOC105225932 isoform X1 [Bactrocera dorsalis]|uniref:Uncharacterized protein LOC105225932 isoform X1 n=1 Tax=Bactrocera dorsalis TaxID=27457 RepID=A0ABM3IYU0_BACDO|nr:uncharacterized protein LOC105225932 isoform X1 [Bactrocera dorsalis]
MLAYPIPGKKFILDTDASAYGIGGVLSQLIDGQERVIGYYSRVLGKPEKNYCVTLKELLAVVECVKHFHKYLYGQRFLLRTDHAALKWLLQFKNPEGQIARWIERLQNYDFETEHRKGIHHKNADALSRRPCPLECKHCSKSEGKEGIIDVRLLNIEPEEVQRGIPFERVTMDVAGPFPTSTAGNKYLRVVMDYFSKWPEVYALPNQEAKTVAEAFVEKWITRFGVPVELHSDQGRNFESSIFQEVCTLLGIHKTRTTALHRRIALCSCNFQTQYSRRTRLHQREVRQRNQSVLKVNCYSVDELLN